MMKSYKIKRIYLLLIAFLLLGTGCSIFEPAPSLTFVDDTVVIKYGAQVNLEDYIEEAKYDEIEIGVYDPLVAGIQKVPFILIRNGKTEEYILNVEVVDSDYPSFTKKTEDILIMENGELDISKFFEASHPVDGILEVLLKEKVDTSKTGVLTLTVIATDGRGKSTETNFTLAIKSKKEYEEIVKNTQPEQIIIENDTAAISGDSSGSTSNGSDVTSPSDNGSSNNNHANNNTNQSKPSNKEFLFKDGYDQITGYEACNAYIAPYTSFARGCEKIPDQSNPALGLGYLAIFY